MCMCFPLTCWLFLQILILESSYLHQFLGDDVLRLPLNCYFNKLERWFMHYSVPYWVPKVTLILNTTCVGICIQLALHHSEPIRQRGMGRMADLFSQSESFAQRSLSAASATLRLHACHHDDGLLSLSCAGTGNTGVTEILRSVRRLSPRTQTVEIESLPANFKKNFTVHWLDKKPFIPLRLLLLSNHFKVDVDHK